MNAGHVCRCTPRTRQDGYSLPCAPSAKLFSVADKFKHKVGMVRPLLTACLAVVDWPDGCLVASFVQYLLFSLLCALLQKGGPQWTTLPSSSYTCALRVPGLRGSLCPPEAHAASYPEAR